MTQNASCTGAVQSRRAGWRKSSFSDPSGNNCVEGRFEPGEMFGLGDTKNPYGPSLSFPLATIQSFLSSVKAGELTPS